MIYFCSKFKEILIEDLKQKDSFSLHFANNFAGFVLFEIQFYQTSETISNYLANACALDFGMWTNDRNDRTNKQTNSNNSKRFSMNFRLLLLISALDNFE